MDPLAKLREALADRYRVDRLLGEGGMALVFLAEDLKHRRPVAIKVLRPEVATALGPERFLREIDVVARLNHPNILSLHDSGETEGLLYFVMPYVEGESLRDRLDHEPRVPLQEGLQVILEIGDALTYAHELGLVHRDIKPANILFQAGHAQVSDFGIAQVASEAAEGLTRTGMTVGTSTYMSPEQLMGEATVDGRTDQYALACLFFEMLTGSPPFEAKTAQASLTRKLVGELPDLLAVRPDVPPTIKDVLLKALAVEPESRFPSMEAFADALREATMTATVEADALRRKRKRRLRGAAQGVAITLLGLGAWWLSTLPGGGGLDRIAVLPLANAGQAPAEEYLLQGVHQDLILELSRAGLRVINPTSVVRYAGTDLGIRQIASELEVDGVIQGTATFREDEIGLNLYLSDAETEEILWSASFRDAPRNIENLYREATRAIAQEMGAELSEEALARLATTTQVDPQVYDYLLQARFHWQKLTTEGIDRAESYYRLAFEQDSTSAEACFGLGQVWFFRVQQGLLPREEAERRGEPYIARARELDPNLSGLQTQLFFELVWGQWDWDGGLEAVENALEEDPTDSLARAYYSHFLFYLNRDQEALAEIEEAIRLDPFNPLLRGIHAMDLNYLHRYEEALEVLNRGMELDPQHPILLSALRTTLHLLGRQDDAIRMWAVSYEALGDTVAAETLAREHQEHGYEEALVAVAELFEDRNRTGSRYAPPWQISTLYTRAGRYDLALDYLEEAFEARDQNIPYISVDPIFDPMRDDPRFQAMMERLGLPM